MPRKNPRPQAKKWATARKARAKDKVKPAPKPDPHYMIAHGSPYSGALLALAAMRLLNRRDDT